MNKHTFVIITCLLCLAISIPLPAQDGFSEIFFDLPAVDSHIDFTGSVAIQVNSEIPFSGTKPNAVFIVPNASFDLLWQERQQKAELGMSFTPKALSDTITFGDVFNLVKITRYVSWGYIEFGYMKKEWGSGNGMHALDPLNAMDQRNGIRFDLLEMKIPEPMLSFNISQGNFSGELVYKPFFQPNLFSVTGRWAIADPALLALIDYSTIPDTHTLEYGQGGIRLRWHAPPIDLGIIGYYGFYPQSAFRYTIDYSTFAVTSISLDYTRGALLGIESTLAAGPLTFMTEVGMWISEDYKGVDPQAYNNKAVYQIGCDYQIPGSNLVSTIQLNGQYVFDFDATDVFDVDTLQAYGDKAYVNNLLVAVDGRWMSERLATQIGLIWNIESSGYAAFASGTWHVDDNIEFNIKATFYGDFKKTALIDSIYERWDANDSVSATCTYRF